MRVRFAPAPSNNLHIGNIKALILNWIYAQKQNGSLLLRIDDTQNTNNNNINSIHDICQWLNIKPAYTFKQSDRKTIYKQYFEILKQNNIIYPCYETKDELKKNTNHVYKKTNNNIYNNSTPTYYRFQLQANNTTYNDAIQGEKEINIAHISDPIVYITASNQFTYLFASSADDIHENITHVIRGNDHITNTFIQQQIMQSIIIFSHKTSHKLPQFAHYGLFLSSETKEKLSKRKGDSFTEHIKTNILPIALIKYIINSGVAKNMNINKNHELHEIIDFLELSNLSNNNIIYDEQMLLTINKNYLQNMSHKQIQSIIPNIDLFTWQLIQHNISTINDITKWQIILNIDNNNSTTDNEQHITILSSILNIIDISKSNTENFTLCKEQLGNKFFKPLRLCLTNQLNGPMIIDIFNFFPLNKIIQRIKKYCNIS
ncbi:MAG: glutamate--tRNA ligase family protein [Pseudomonadota bacterium]